MINIFTIGVNGKTAKIFFEILKANNIDVLIDIRLNNNSQLAGYSKGGDEFLGYLLNEICHIKYVHDSYLAPTKEILENYHQTHNWDEYVKKFNTLIETRNIRSYFINKYGAKERICLLCSEATDDKCHRRLIAESIVSKEDIVHL